MVESKKSLDLLSKIQCTRYTKFKKVLFRALPLKIKGE